MAQTVAGAGAAIVLEARAKVNLTLEILGKRADGYHNLASVMQTVELHDSVTVGPSSSLIVECDDDSIPQESNLAMKAALALREQVGVRSGAHIKIAKRIPVAAGLGGGSSDAAAALLGLTRLWALELPPHRLEQVAASVGSDVPFFLEGGTALVQGRGDEIVPLPPASIEWIVILSPALAPAEKTKAAFARIEPGLYTRGTLTHKLAGRIRGGGDVPAQFLFNAFDSIASELFTGLQEYREAFARVGTREITLSGTGPSMFALAPSREIGLAWQLMLQSRYGWDAFLTRAWRPQAARGHRGYRGQAI